MTPGQQALDNAIRLRVSEISTEHHAQYFPTDWVLVMAGQEMDQTDTTFVLSKLVVLARYPSTPSWGCWSTPRRDYERVSPRVGVGAIHETTHSHYA